MNREDLPMNDCKIHLEINDAECRIEMKGSVLDLGSLLALSASTSEQFKEVLLLTAKFLESEQGLEAFKQKPEVLN